MTQDFSLCSGGPRNAEIFVLFLIAVVFDVKATCQHVEWIYN